MKLGCSTTGDKSPQLRLIAALGILLLGLSATVQAVDKNAGTSGAQFLKIGAGARPTSMGDAFVGIADDVNAVYFNPGGLGLLEKREFTAMRTQYFQGLDYNFGAYVHPVTQGTWGISGATLQTDDITRTDTDESITGTFQNQDSTYGLSYGHRFGEHLGIGGTIRWINQDIDTASASTWAADVGVLKRFEGKPYTIGLAIKNVGRDIQFNEESDPLPLTFDLGGAIALLNNRLIVATDVKKVRDSGVKLGAGMEWRQQIGEKVRYAGRIGYNGANTDADGANGISLGAGLGYRLMDFDFAWVPFGDLGNTFRYAAHFKF